MLDQTDDVVQPALIPSAGSSVDSIVQIVLDSVSSVHTRRAYERALRAFLGWYRDTHQAILNKATVQRYAADLQASGLSAANINQRLSAIRKLATEAADNAVLPEPLANGIKNVKGVRREGHTTGNWLTKEQAQKLINAPDIETTKGLRDRAILSVLIGCGLRRTEAAQLTCDHIQQREGRWILVDLVGKRNKVRSVPMPSWTKAAVDAWTEAAAIREGRVFRRINRGGALAGPRMSDQAIANMVRQYGGELGMERLAAHDLRRTFAKLAHKGGAALEQIQLSLGHASLKTTEVYLGVEQNLTDAPCDHLGLRLE